ncbi:MAG TPA: hypothetical protein PK014_13895 [Thermoanaerobaculia bacterium]|nr:hypothetical protein [Thermoanaerobaculia bacterium]HUM31113.1 hypothetical protein [Thermoanaerobaculia bacterium]HXK69488.1 hypothetical protein [Thermoanaerobaculia bacterium]
MKMLMIITSTECREEVESFLKDQKVPGYTEIPTVYGEGHTGPKFGSWAFPGTSTIIFTVVPNEQFDEVMKVLREHCTRCQYHSHILSWDVDEVEVKP